ncbi:unnamed protein product [Chironomus riparius]|uniref:Uncharacterized protein n=1 Tax=Chironomus riparius TaxID=315576 RepID=A0A9N9WZE6_9DIPT|nr:unnamed protein product [Chironomus riparius]
MSNRKNYDGDIYLRSRSISEPEISFDKSAICTNRFKPKHFPFEYIPVDDLHYYRRRKPCNCKKSVVSVLFVLNNSLACSNSLSLSFYSLIDCNNNRSEPLLNRKSNSTEYSREYTEKTLIGKLPPINRPSNLKVDAYPFLTGLYRSDTSLNHLNYSTEYDTNFHSRPYSPRIGLIRRPTNIKLNAGIMDIRSEQKSQFRAYPDHVISCARPPMIKKPNNLHLIGNIELFPEYRSKYIPYSVDSINRSNKIPCYHSKHEKRKSKEVKVDCERKDIVERRQQEEQIMEDSRQVKEAKILNNNYGVSCSNRYHEKLDYENNNYVPEYRSKYRAVIGEKSALIPQQSHFEKYTNGYNPVSEYNNRYKSYDQFIKSAPIKKQDNLYLKGDTQMRPEYNDRYKEIDMKSYSRQQSIKQQDNLHSNGQYPLQVPEYSEKYKSYDSSTMPERSKGREDYLCLNGNMDYDPEYRNNYVEFPRQRPIVKKPATHIQLSSNERQERKPDNLNLPINVPPISQINSVKKTSRNASFDSDEIPIESTPEYRKAMRNYMIKERSPSRGPSPEAIQKEKEKEKKAKEKVDHNNVTKILTENKVNVPEEKMFDANNEVIVEQIKPPSNFKIPTRSPTNLTLGRGASYPIQKEKFSEHLSVSRKPRKNYDVSFDEDNGIGRPRMQTVDFIDSDIENNNMAAQQQQQQQQQQQRYRAEEKVENYQRPQYPRRSPKFGRRAALPKEDYQIRKKTNVIEGNTTYSRDYCPNKHEQRSYHLTPSNAIQFAQAPADSLANNYRPNYEIDKQQSYRESLGNNEPFVVLDRQLANKVKQSSWMKKQWYDTN